MKIRPLLIGLIVIVIIGGVYFFIVEKVEKNKLIHLDYPVACTMEAKLCPDGSAVGRSGPKCEFAECPSAGGIQGTVMAGPTCPVMQNPPDLKCNDKPLKANVSVYRASDTSHSIATLESGADGTFKVSLPQGEYVVMAGPFGMPLPRCSDTTATVGASGYTQISVSCDTGIR